MSKWIWRNCRVYRRSLANFYIYVNINFLYFHKKLYSYVYHYIAQVLCLIKWTWNERVAFATNFPIYSNYIIASFNQRLFSKNSKNNNVTILNARTKFFFSNASNQRLESENGKYKDKRDERVSGEMKGGNLAMIGWTVYRKRERVFSIFPWASFSVAARPIVCIRSKFYYS